MEKTFRSIAVYGLALVMAAVLLAPAGAQGKVSNNHAATIQTSQMCGMPGMQAKDTKTAVPESFSKIKLPCTFVCKHCGIKITVKTPADWTKPCPACPCGTAVWQCYPTKGK